MGGAPCVTCCRSILKRLKPAASVCRAATSYSAMIAANRWKTD